MGMDTGTLLTTVYLSKFSKISTSLYVEVLKPRRISRRKYMKLSRIIFLFIFFIASCQGISAKDNYQAYGLSDLLKVVDDSKDRFYSDTDNIKSAQRLKSLAVKKFFPQVSVQGSQSIYRETGNGTSIIPEQKNYMNTLSVTQPLFLGGKLVGNYVQAKNRETFFNLIMDSMLLRHKYKVLFLYYEHNKLSEIQKLAKEFESKITASYEKINDLNDVGDISYLRYQDASQKYEQYQQEVLLNENSIEKTTFMLSNQLGLTSNMEILTEAIVFPTLNPSVKHYIQIGLKDRLELQSAKLNALIQDKDVFLRNPNIETYLSYQNTWTGRSFPPEDPDWSVGITVKVPIIDELTTHAGKTFAEPAPNAENEINSVGFTLFDQNELYNRTISELERLNSVQYIAGIEDLKRSIPVEITNAFFESKNKKIILGLLDKENIRNQKKKQAFLEEYENGRISESDYLEYLVNELKSKINYIQNKYAYLADIKNLNQACGREPI